MLHDFILVSPKTASLRCSVKNYSEEFRIIQKKTRAMASII